MTRFYHFWSSMPAQRVRLALAYKQVPHEAIALSHDDDAVFFDHGVAHADCLLLRDNGEVATDPLRTLESLDEWLGGRPILQGVLPPEAWNALLNWRNSVEHVLGRLYAAVLPGFLDIEESEAAHAACKAEIEHKYGMSLEELTNDRYDGFNQLSAMSRLKDLGRHLGKEKFYYGGQLSAADILLACDLFPLQLLDGVTVPLDIMYYIKRVEDACGASPRDGVVATLATAH